MKWMKEMNGSAFLPCWGLCKRLSRSSGGLRGAHDLTIFMLTLLHDLNSLLSLIFPAVIFELLCFPRSVTELLSNSGLAHCLCLPGCQPILPPAGTVGEKLLFSSVDPSLIPVRILPFFLQFTVWERISSPKRGCVKFFKFDNHL